MSRLIYIETLRRVTPDNGREKTDFFDFHLIGTFDALKITLQDIHGKSIDTIEKFQRLSRERHAVVPEMYDKQPMCLYTEQDQDLHIFEKDGKFAHQPLVMTLIQLHDKELNVTAPSSLVNAFEQELEAVKKTDSEFENLDSAVFYSLGEADIVIVFRSETVHTIARLLYRLRLWDTTIAQKEVELNPGIIVLSTCSHCAFPAENKREAFASHLQTWLTHETEKGTVFCSLADTSYGTDNNKNTDSDFVFGNFLLGEYDFASTWPEDANERVKWALENIFNLDQPTDDTALSSRMVYTFPVVHLSESDKAYSESKRQLNDIQTDYEPLLHEYVSEDSDFKRLADRLRECDCKNQLFGSNEHTEYLARKVDTFADTLTALLKHLIRLKEGRFEGDLYAYVIPAFEALPKVAESYIQLLDKLFDRYAQIYNEHDRLSLAEVRTLSRRANALMAEYMQDVSRLISYLQHLFSVMAVSPHTYLETYGSSMRSVTATCKLLGAYQGIAYKIAENCALTLKYNNTGTDVPIHENMLILPYRSIRQNTRTLFEHSSPLYRIVSVQIDFADMMYVDKTLFVLLHEFGHHIIPGSVRTERQEYYVKAAVASLLQAGLGDLYERPYECLDLPLYLQADCHAETSQRIIWDEDEIFVDDFQKSLKKYIRPYIEDLYRIFVSKKDSWYYCNYAKEEPYAMDNAFSRILRIILKETFQELIAGAFVSSANSLYIALGEIYEKIILPIYEARVYAQYEKEKFSDSISLWNLSELCVWYHNARKSQKEQSEFLDKIILSMLKEMEGSLANATKELSEAFSDIYSDIFAFYMLRLDESLVPASEEAKRYLQLFREVVGFEIERYVNPGTSLIRLNILLTKCYGISENETEVFILDLLPSESSLREETREGLQSICKSLYYNFVSEYADMCISEVKKLRDKSAHGLTDTTRKLNLMYLAARTNDLKGVVDQVHYFWQASNKR